MSHVGIDIVDIERFRAFSMKSHARLLARIYRPEELAYCLSAADPAQRLAARFAAKEAVIKALSQADIQRVDYKNIEILHDALGRPSAVLHGYPIHTAKISISHSDSAAAAVAMVE